MASAAARVAATAATPDDQSVQEHDATNPDRVAGRRTRLERLLPNRIAATRAFLAVTAALAIAACDGGTGPRHPAAGVYRMVGDPISLNESGTGCPTLLVASTIRIDSKGDATRRDSIVNEGAYSIVLRGGAELRELALSINYRHIPVVSCGAPVLGDRLHSTSADFVGDTIVISTLHGYLHAGAGLLNHIPYERD